MRRVILMLGAAVTLLLSVASPAAARELSQQEALSRAQSELRQASRQPGARPTSATTGSSRTLSCVYTQQADISSRSTPAFYIFSSQDKDGGWVIASADDRLRPVLGMSDTGSIDLDNIPPAMRWWLDQYRQEIEAFLSSSAAYDTEPYEYLASRSADRRTIDYLIQTKWNQDSPFNNLCPIDNNAPSVTGCVATAMAQVVRFHQFFKGQGHISYQTGKSATVSYNFETAQFDWNNMLDVYVDGNYSEQEATAVADLMLACGASVEMNYTSDASGALSAAVPHALQYYFGYTGTEYFLHKGISQADWENLAYTALSQGLPIIMGGQSSKGGGHEFICDGYDRATDLFHINWGWGGYSDNYFTLSALNPDNQGIGGSEGGYDLDQDFIIAVPEGKSFIPPADLPDVSLIASEYTYQQDATNLIITPRNISNTTGYTLHFNLYFVILDNEGNSAAEIPYSGNLELPAGYFFQTLEISVPYEYLTSLGLADGEYYATLQYSLDDDTTLHPLEAETKLSALKFTKTGNDYSLLEMTSYPGGEKEPSGPVLADRIEISTVTGNQTLTVPAYASEPATLAFIANVTADSGEKPDNESVTWSISGNKRAGVDIDAKTGVLSATREAADGTTVIVVAKANDGSETVSNGIEITIKVAPEAVLEMTALSAPSPIVIGRDVQKIGADVKNSGAGIFRGKISIIFEKKDNSAIQARMDFNNVVIDPNGTVNLGPLYETFAGKLSKDNIGEYNVYLMAWPDEAAGNSIAVKGIKEVTVSDIWPVTEITLAADKPQLKAGETATVTPTLIPADATEKNLTYTTSDPESLVVIGIDNEGKATVKVTDNPALGTVTITATTTDGSELSASVEFTIVYTPVSAITVTPAEKSIEITKYQSATEKQTVQFEAAITPATATYTDVEWSVEGCSAATIDENGLLTVSRPDDNAGEYELIITATHTDPVTKTSLAAKSTVTLIVEEKAKGFEADGVVYAITGENTVSVIGFTDKFVGNGLAAEVSDGSSSFTVTEIAAGAFKGCEALAKIVIPATVKTIGDGAFAGCANLISVTVLSDTPAEIAGQAFDDAAYSTVMLAVPDGTGEAYRQGGEWGRFVNIVDGASGIEGIEADGGEAVIYDLTGRRVKNPTSGFYIVNGRKVLIRR